MDNLEEITRLPDDFDGQVRLFPLPELVLFPHALQPVHIFEPRYCELLLDAHGPTDRDGDTRL
jgi:ATP-dependent Lon protease